MSDEMQSSPAHQRLRRMRSMLGFKHHSRMIRTTRHSPRILPLALPQSQNSGLQLSVITLAFQTSSPNATRVLSSTSSIFVSLMSLARNLNPVSRSASTLAPTSTLRMRSWTRRISIRRKWDIPAILSMTVRSEPKSSGRRTKT